MKHSSRLARCLFATVVSVLLSVSAAAQNPPPQFDLRDVGGQSFVTSVKDQSGGTCWTFGAMAAIESNLLMSGAWSAAGETGEPALAEYHLDWWNGFNEHNNDDISPPSGSGLEVHMGGDYMVTSAYLTRGEGAVRDIDGQSYTYPPLRSDPSYHYFYPREIEWFTAGAALGNIDTIKDKIMTQGVMGTCMCYDAAFINGEYEHYQPKSSTMLPNHAIAIIGWDDTRVTDAPLPGAWLVKNSWGSSWGNGGFFWIAYEDKHACQEPEMGAISFKDVVPFAFDRVYHHDYHGWRNTLTGVTEAFNVFTATEIGERVEAVSFFSAADGVAYTVKIYDRFTGGVLLDELASVSGTAEYRGFHTCDLPTPVSLVPGDDFFVYVSLATGGHPYDQTSDVPVLLGASYRTIVVSASSPDQSYYYSAGAWNDLYASDNSANFCIKALVTVNEALIFDFPGGVPEEVQPPGPNCVMAVEIGDSYENYVPGSGVLLYRFDPADSYSPVSMTSLGGDLYEAVLPHTAPGDQPEFYFRAEGDGGTTVSSPPTAPAAVYSFDVAFSELILADDFETDQGWTIQSFNLSAGEWEREVPSSTTGGQVAPLTDNPAGTGTRCFLTDNGPPGSTYSNHDIDGGPTQLISPTIDLSGGDARISAYNWYYSRDGDDAFEVDVSNDNGSSWSNVYSSTSSLNGWWRIAFDVSDHVIPTAEVKVRYSAQDQPNNDIVEAGVDDFEVVQFDHAPTLYADGYEVSGTTGGSIDFTLDPGAANAGRPYLLIAGMSGRTPGLDVAGLHLPLNPDWFSDYILGHLSAPVLQGFWGVLDPQGRAVVDFDLAGPEIAPFAGETMTFVFVVAGPLTFASNAVDVVIEP
jgi:C1A family cysteine protease